MGTSHFRPNPALRYCEHYLSTWAACLIGISLHIVAKPLRSSICRVLHRSTYPKTICCCSEQRCGKCETSHTTTQHLMGAIARKRKRVSMCTLCGAMIAVFSGSIHKVQTACHALPTCSANFLPCFMCTPVLLTSETMIHNTYIPVYIYIYIYI